LVKLTDYEGIAEPLAKIEVYVCDRGDYQMLAAANQELGNEKKTQKCELCE